MPSFFVPQYLKKLITQNVKFKYQNKIVRYDLRYFIYARVKNYDFCCVCHQKLVQMYWCGWFLDVHFSTYWLTLKQKSKRDNFLRTCSEIISITSNVFFFFYICFKFWVINSLKMETWWRHKNRHLNPLEVLIKLLNQWNNNLTLFQKRKEKGIRSILYYYYRRKWDKQKETCFILLFYTIG